MKKFISYLLSSSIIAFSSPVLLADWENIDLKLTEMIDFTSFRKNRNKWCWLSCSLKLIEYWIRKYESYTYINNVNQKLLKQFKIMSGCVKRNIRNFQIYEPLFKELNKVLENYEGQTKIQIMSDQRCDLYFLSKALENILNEIFDKKDKNLFKCCYYDWISSTLNTNPNSITQQPYDIAKDIILKSKCPLVVGVGLVKKSDRNKIAGKEKYLKKYGLNYVHSKCAKDICIYGHCYLVTGIDDTIDGKRVKLVDPTKNKIIEFNKEEFNNISLIFLNVNI